MRKILVLLIVIGLFIPALSYAKTAQIFATALNGGAAGALDAVECEDILGDNTNRAIATGDIAAVATSNSSVLVCV